MAKLSLKTQGVTGKEPKWTERVGSLHMYLENNSWICADAYEGKGDSYKPRLDTLVSVVQDGELLFSGTIFELCNKLKK